MKHFTLSKKWIPADMFLCFLQTAIISWITIDNLCKSDTVVCEKGYEFYLHGLHASNEQRVYIKTMYSQFCYHACFVKSELAIKLMMNSLTLFFKIILYISYILIINYFIPTNALHYFSVFLSLYMFRHSLCHHQRFRREFTVHSKSTRSNTIAQLIYIASCRTKS
jgi:hypothetical protein